MIPQSGLEMYLVYKGESAARRREEKTNYMFNTNVPVLNSLFCYFRCLTYYIVPSATVSWVLTFVEPEKPEWSRNEGNRTRRKPKE